MNRARAMAARAMAMAKRVVDDDKGNATAARAMAMATRMAGKRRQW